MKRNCISGRIPSVAKERNCCAPLVKVRGGILNNARPSESNLDQGAGRFWRNWFVIIAAVLAVLAVGAACMGAEPRGVLLKPPLAAPGTADAWTLTVYGRGPTTTIKVWVDPGFWRYYAADGVPLGWYVNEALWNYSRVCGIGWDYTPDINAARVRIHCATPAEVWRITNGTGQVAVTPNFKPGSGATDCYVAYAGKTGKAHPAVNAIRLPQHEVGHCLGMGHSADPIACMNSDCSAPVRYTSKPENLARYGCAGFNAAECNYLAGRFGPLWLFKYEAGL